MARLKALRAKADELARSRISDERKAMDLSRLLVHWMINGKPSREPNPKAEQNIGGKQEAKKEGE